MKNLKVGTKILLGFGIVIVMLLVMAVTGFFSNTSNINNSQNVDQITSLQSMCNTLKSDYMEARIKANVLYVIISEDVYNEFVTYAASVEKQFTDVMAFIDAHPELEPYRAGLAEDGAAFDAWRLSVEDVRKYDIARDEMKDEMATYGDNATKAGDDLYALILAANNAAIESGNTETIASTSKSLDTGAHIMQQIATARLGGVRLQLSLDASYFEAAEKTINDLVTQLDAISAKTANPSSKAKVDEVSKAMKEYLACLEKFAETCVQSDSTVADAKVKGTAAKDKMDVVLAAMDTDANAVIADTSKSASNSRATTIIIAIVAVVAAVIIALYISNIITKPLKFLAAYVKSIADSGNLLLVEENKADCDNYGSYKDEVGDTVRAVNSLFDLMQFQGSILKRIANKDINHYVKLRSPKCTIGLIATDLLDQLNDVMGNMQISAAQVSSGSQQVADGAQTLAQGATEQAATVEELSASITEVAGKTKENARLANDASSLAETIKSNAQKGSDQMGQMMKAVQEINEASQSINKVIKVIDDIAFQTNILALNAAVEAARAGQHGKGFAVVADEVRSLASKSAEAAKSTSELIADSMAKAELGSRIAEETSKSLQEIVDGINESSKLVSTIARSSEDQSSAIFQINEGISQVANVVQQNSATSEESAAASEEMASQADVLSRLAAQFKIRPTADNGMAAPSIGRSMTSCEPETGFAVSAH